MYHSQSINPKKKKKTHSCLAKGLINLQERTCAEGSEVLDGLGDHISVQPHHDAPGGLASDVHIEEALRRHLRLQLHAVLLRHRAPHHHAPPPNHSRSRPRAACCCCNGGGLGGCSQCIWEAQIGRRDQTRLLLLLLQQTDCFVETKARPKEKWIFGMSLTCVVEFVQEGLVDIDTQ